MEIPQSSTAPRTTAEAVHVPRCLHPTAGSSPLAVSSSDRTQVQAGK